MTSQDDTVNAYRKLRTYCDDLAARYEAIEAWRNRHPDHHTDLYQADATIYHLREQFYGVFGDKPLLRTSTFDPDDPMPANTHDLLTSKRFIDIMQLALGTYEATTNKEAR